MLLVLKAKTGRFFEQLQESLGNNIYKWSSALKNVVVYNPKLSQCIHLFIISYLFIDIVCYGKQFLWMQMVPNGNILRSGLTIWDSKTTIHS